MAVKETLPQTLNDVDDFYNEIGYMTTRVQNNTLGIGLGVLGGASAFAGDADAQTKKSGKPGEPGGQDFVIPGVNPRVKTADNAWAFYDPDRFKGTVLEGLGDPYKLSPETMADLSQKVKDIQKWIRCTKCHCTFECATNVSVLYDLKGSPDLIKRTIQSSFKSRLN